MMIYTPVKYSLERVLEMLAAVGKEDLKFFLLLQFSLSLCISSHLQGILLHRVLEHNKSFVIRICWKYILNNTFIFFSEYQNTLRNKIGY